MVAHSAVDEGIELVRRSSVVRKLDRAPLQRWKLDSQHHVD